MKTNHQPVASGDPSELKPACHAEVLLRGEDGKRTLHLRRTLADGLQSSEDGLNWRPCPSLQAHGIRYAYLTFEGESHGFRKAENIVASLEAELSFYGQIMGFTPPGVPAVPLAGG